MRRWGYNINALHETARVWLEEAPWWVFWLNDVTEWICDHIPSCRIPLIGRIRITRDGRKYTIRAWYGDDTFYLFHLCVHDPVFAWCGKRTRMMSVYVAWDEAKELFYDKDKAYWDEEIETAEQQRAEDDAQPEQVVPMSEVLTKAGITAGDLADGEDVEIETEEEGDAE